LEPVEILFTVGSHVREEINQEHKGNHQIHRTKLQIWHGYMDIHWERKIHTWISFKIEHLGKTIDDYVTAKTLLNDNLKTACSVLWGYCSNIMWLKKEDKKGNEIVSPTVDAIKFLKIIKRIAFNYLLYPEKYRNFYLF
jgi:hypothetical protein